jgi:periplasmic divalent cation tolerance protein
MKIILTNVPPDKAEEIVKILVEEHSVACVNFYPVQSVYFWKGKVCVDQEVTLMMKVAVHGVDALKKRIQELHPYELPEIIALDVDIQASLKEYVQFVHQETQQR